jgi:hypothetical protein
MSPEVTATIIAACIMIGERDPAQVVITTL